MPPDMRVQTPLLKGVFSAAMALIAAAVLIPEVRAQALLVERLPGGTHLGLVNQPLADATTLVWPEVSDDREAVIGRLTVGRLTIAADVEAAFGAAETEGSPTPAPPVIVAVGGASADELSSLLERVLGDRPAAPVVVPSPPVLVEGGLDRRLGAPGSEALLRFEILLPPPGDSRRSSVEVLWDLVPQLLSDTIPILQSRVEDDRGMLDGRVDAEIAEITVSDLRLQLARIASDPNLQADDVAEARRRLQVRRYAALEEHPDAAVKVLERWLSGGEEAVRELVFGIQAVTIQSVREAAAEWLPTHPGHAQLILPPRVFNPRFAVGPQIHQLENDLAAAILERASAPLSVVVLRPVMVPDLDGEVTATVLARLARELRSAESRPGFVRVRTDPPLIEVAGPADGFGELLEQLTSAYVAVASDRSPVTTSGDDARRRALDLMAGLLGVTEAEEIRLRRPSFVRATWPSAWSRPMPRRRPRPWANSGRLIRATVVRRMSRACPRSRAPGSPPPGTSRSWWWPSKRSSAGTRPHSMVLRELLETRAGALWPDSRVEVLRPYVPGRSLLLVEVAANETVDEVERAVVEKWSSLTSGAGEAELAPVKRRVAAAASAEMSGVAGHARLCAATAAGASRWHQPAEFELEILTVDAEMINLILKSFSDFSTLETTGAGALPITELQRR